ncbi:MAG: methyltransferase domain-containing protein [Alphaproteobacteria bacterium]|nr:methyltransferase domain-containing protein [Alphaproteobacteria bacterium]
MPPEVTNPLPPQLTQRIDDGDDALFYAPPRLVTHIDAAAIAALGACFVRRLPAGGAILDLMSSWVSHLPEVDYRSVTGLGMNQVELDANPRLTHRLVHDLNRSPALPFAAAAFDACLITVSVQYLTRPVAVFAEIARVLRPGGECLVTFSNRLFPTKAIALWRALDAAGHADLVAFYFRSAGGFSDLFQEDLSPAPGRSDPLWLVGAATKA